MRISDCSSDVGSSDLVKMAAKFDLKAYAGADMAPKALVTSLTARKKEPAMPPIEKTAEEIAAEAAAKRSEERRVGTACVGTCRSWLSPDKYKCNHAKFYNNTSET